MDHDFHAVKKAGAGVAKIPGDAPDNWIDRQTLPDRP
jgi:hypothetical protein